MSCNTGTACQRVERFRFQSNGSNLAQQADQAGVPVRALASVCLELEVTTAFGTPKLLQFEATAIDRELKLPIKLGDVDRDE